VWNVDAFETGVSTTEKARRDVISENFFLANYNADFAVDNDDGSQMYDIHHNFLIYGRNGLKTDFGGHDMTAHHNIYAWPEINCMIDQNQQKPGHTDVFHSNKCVLGTDGECSAYIRGGS
jgi:hypothetical protein